MLRTLFLMALLSASAATTRAETVVVSTTPSSAETLYDRRTPSDPNNVYLRVGMLEAYDDARVNLYVTPDIVFAVDAPAQTVLASAVLELHVAMSQLVFSGPYLSVFGYLDDDGAVEIGDFSKPSTYVGSSGSLGNLGDPLNYVDVLVSIDVTSFIRSASEHEASFVGFKLGGALVLVYPSGDDATAPRLVSTFNVVPEPSSFVMAGTAALAGLGVMRRRRFA